MELDANEKELLKRLKEASKKESHFCLTLTIDDEVLAMREFSANQFSKEAIVSTRTHFMMKDLMKLIIKHYDESEEIYQNERKKIEIDKLWNDKEKNKK